MKQVLYKRSSNGKTQQWTIVVEGNGFHTSEGFIDGVKSATEVTWCFGKRKGASNATSDEEQALKEAEAKITKQKKKGWAESIQDIDATSRKHLPMLAKKWEDEEEKILSTAKVLAVQPKLDGIRMIGTIEGPFSKEGNLHNPAAFYIHNTASLPLLEFIENAELDGELYNHEYKADFNTIASIVRKQKPNEEQLALAKEKLQYHLYDINTRNAEDTFAQRHAALTLLVEGTPSNSIKLVETVFINLVGQSRPDIDKQLLSLHKRFIDEGYEGSMIRDAGSKYEQKRVRSLLKRKDWVDDEFEIIDIIEGKGNKARMAASVLCKDKRGEEFSAGIIGTEDYCECILAMKADYIGEMATIKYQNLTPDRKVPRFAKMKTIRPQGE